MSPVSNSNHKVCVFVLPMLQKVNTSGNKYFLQTISMSIRSHPFKTAQRSLIINYCLNFTSSLLISDISQSFKVVVIKPLLKKPLLDSTVLANFRLISSLSLISKKSWYKSAMWSFAVEWLIWWGSVRF